MVALDPTPLREPRTGIRGWFSSREFRFSPYVYIAPFFISFAIFGAYPLIYNIWVALHDWHRRFGAGDFVGMSNFTWVLSQPRFWSSLQNTFSIWLLTIIPQLVVSLFLAAMLDQNLRTKTFWRMSVLVPYVVMPVATALIFGQIFNQFGLIVPHLHNMGLFTDLTAPFTQNRALSHLAIATMVNFRWTGYNALIFLAAMQAVPRELYEAATVDGAGRMRQFFSVTIPNIRPTLIFVVLTMTIGGLQIFDEVRLFDDAGQGGSNNQWGTIVLYLYNLAFGNWQDRLGQAAAVGWILAFIVVIFTLINFFLTKSISSGESKPTRTSHKAWKAVVEERNATWVESRNGVFTGLPAWVEVEKEKKLHHQHRPHEDWEADSDIPYGGTDSDSLADANLPIPNPLTFEGFDQ